MYIPYNLLYEQQIKKAIDFAKNEMRDNVDAYISVADLKKFAEQHSEIPRNDDDAFIWAYEFNESEGDPDPNKYNEPACEHIIVFSTQRLLRNLLNASVIQADGTYKLTWQGSPLLIVGVNDVDQHFNLVAMTLSTKENKRAYSLTFSAIVAKANELYGADITNTITKLIGDAAPQLKLAFSEIFPNGILRNCWYHVKAGVKKNSKFTNETNRALALRDLSDVHRAPSQKFFDKSIILLKQKWAKEPSFIDALKFWS